MFDLYFFGLKKDVYLSLINDILSQKRRNIMWSYDYVWGTDSTAASTLFSVTLFADGVENSVFLLVK